MNTDTLQSVDERAAVWVARVFSGELTLEEKTSLEVWLSQDDRHRRAYSDMMKVGGIVEGAVEGPTEQILEQDLVAFAARKEKPRYWVAVPAIAAGFAVFFSVVALLPATTEKSKQYATLRGQSMEVILDDKSVIALNTDTSLSVIYTDQGRAVSMDRGEAFFDIVPDLGRPFVVTSPYASVNVTGTRFVMRALETKAFVAVLSGAVVVAPAEVNDKDEPGVSLLSGQSVSIKPYAGLQDVTGFDADSMVAWRRGMAFYDSVSLADVITDLNRYFENQFVLGDEELANIPVSGGFDIGNQDIVIEALSVALSLRVERKDSGAVVLWPKQ